MTQVRSLAAIPIRLDFGMEVAGKKGFANATRKFDQRVPCVRRRILGWKRMAKKLLKRRGRKQEIRARPLRKTQGHNKSGFFVSCAFFSRWCSSENCKQTCFDITPLSYDTPFFLYSQYIPRVMWHAGWIKLWLFVDIRICAYWTNFVNLSIYRPRKKSV